MHVSLHIYHLLYYIKVYLFIMVNIDQLIIIYYYYNLINSEKNFDI